ncbi:MAG: hypothetical protein Q8O34_13215 [Rhodocyclaceae bacterium]|nr:hypothetical protein [Rhodocyclaceae bacterium]
MKGTDPIKENAVLRYDIDYLKKKIKQIANQKDKKIKQLERENAELKKNLKCF